MSEIGRLERLVEAIPEVRQLAELRRVLALYDTKGYEKVVEIVDGIQERAKTAGRKMTPERQQALAVAKEFVKSSTLPIKTVDILTHIRGQGIEIGGADPVNSLSARLSTSGDFTAHGRSGWTMAKNREEAAQELAELFGDDPAPKVEP
jgi:hypothetical protein